MNLIGKKLHRDRNEILNFCGRHDRVHIFGAGTVADLVTSFSLYQNKRLQDAIVTCYGFCKAIADVVASREYLNIEKMNLVCVPLKKEIEFLAEQIEMISFIHESCIIVKT